MRRFLSRLLVNLAGELNPAGSIVWTPRRCALPMDVAVEMSGAIFINIIFDSAVDFAGKNTDFSGYLGLKFEGGE